MAAVTTLPAAFVANTVLTADQLNNLRGAFRTLQVVAVSSTTAVATTSTSFVTSGLSTSITPSSSSSKILVQVTFPFDSSSGGTQAHGTLFRGTVAGTNLAAGGDPTTGNILGTGQLRGTYTASFLDSPATTSATTYTVGIKVSTGTTLTAMINGSTGTLVVSEISA